MPKTYKYRIYPTNGQEGVLKKMLEECRWLYNDTLAYRKNAWEQEQHSVNWFETKRRIPELKKSRESLRAVHSQVLQNVTERVDLAFKSFFRRVKSREQKVGYPRFKGKGRYDSLTYPQYENGFRFDDDGNLVISKLGTLKIELHRPIEGTIKTLTLRRTATGKWFACFSCEDVPEHPLLHSDKAVGIDVGLESFATYSGGTKVENPRFFRKDEKDLAKAQSKRDKAPKDSSRRKHLSRAVAHIHERIANRRGNFAHQLSRKLVNEFGIICFENLNIQNMMQNGHLAKSIGDAAWSQLIQYTSYKAVDAGRIVVKVDPNGTSQRCSRCGTVVKKTLSVRIHDCNVCGLSLDRDHNAAINILALGLQSIGVNP